MGQVSIWHWIVVLVVLVGPIVAIVRVKPSSRIARQTFIRLLIIDVALVVIAIVVFNASTTIPVFLAGAGLFLVYFCYRIYFIAKVATRLATLGWSRWWSLLGAPVIGVEIVLGLVLSILKTAEEAGPPALGRNA